MGIIQDKKRLSNGASFSLANRLKRVLWQLVVLCLFRFSPRPLYAWRCFLLRCFGAKIGKHCHVYPKVFIWAPWSLEMADHSCLADDVICYSQDKIILGERAIVSQGAYLCTGSHDYKDPEFQLITAPISIEKDAWVCTQSFVGLGVTVAEGAVLGARSVTFKDLHAWKIYAGNPAVYIKDRILSN